MSATSTTICDDDDKSEEPIADVAGEGLEMILLLFFISDNDPGTGFVSAIFCVVSFIVTSVGDAVEALSDPPSNPLLMLLVVISSLSCFFLSLFVWLLVCVQKRVKFHKSVYSRTN